MATNIINWRRLHRNGGLVFLNSLQLCRMEAEDGRPLSRRSLEHWDALVEDSNRRLTRLADVDAIQDTMMAGGEPGIAYETTAGGRTRAEKKPGAA